MKYKVFTQGDFSWQPDGNYKSIHISNADTSIVILGNFDVIAGDLNPEFQHTGIWYDFFSGNQVEITDANATLSFNPGEFHIYTDIPLHIPDVITAIESIVSEGNLSLYPNPTVDILYVDVQLQNSYLIDTGYWSIINMMGKEVMRGDFEFSKHEIKVSSLSRGIYTFVFVKAGNRSTMKFIKN
jgi:hypothetical protein